MRLDIYQNEHEAEILKAIGIKKEDIPRPRGVGIDGGLILIHTRTGGGNREGYLEQNDKLTQNKYYIEDEDEVFDCTYANFWFEIPEQHKEALLKMEDVEAKAVYGDAEIAIGLQFGDKKCIDKAWERLETVRKQK